MNYYTEVLVDAINLCIDRQELSPFLRDLLTETEIRMLAKRLQIAVMLNEGHTYQTISTHLKVTNQTIANIAKILDYGEGGLQELSDKIIEIKEESREKSEKSDRQLLKAERERESQRNIKQNLPQNAPTVVPEKPKQQTKEKEQSSSTGEIVVEELKSSPWLKG